MGELNSKYKIINRTLNIYWTVPPAITIPARTRPEIFYCMEIYKGTATESIGYNKTAVLSSAVQLTMLLLRPAGMFLMIRITRAMFVTIGLILMPVNLLVSLPVIVNVILVIIV